MVSVASQLQERSREVLEASELESGIWRVSSKQVLTFTPDKRTIMHFTKIAGSNTQADFFVQL